MFQSIVIFFILFICFKFIRFKLMMQLFSFCYKRKKAKRMRYRLFVKKGFSIIAYFQRGGKYTKK